MESLKIYRKRLIPAETVLLKDDTIVDMNDDYIVTKWQTLKPKAEFSHGASCYYLKEGIKVSKFYKKDDSLLYWYCDIVNYEYEGDNTLIVTDLLADVIVYPDGRLKVLDLDELAEAREHSLIDDELLCKSLRQLNALLVTIDRDKFDKLKEPLDSRAL
ncbi:MAG: DUF402 domain-containing protein [Lachnospiraceae bacterium]|nr:DUF402 domain-containing protein [Lachnospiraceae bacterium]